MDNELETEHKWSTERGIKVANINMLINYDEPTKEILGTIRSDDAEIRKAKRLGKAFSNDMTGMMAAASAEAMKGAAKNEGGAMLGFMGMGMAQQQGANMLGAAGNIASQQAPAAPAAAPAEDPTEKLLNAKKLLDAGAITQEDYDKLKSQILGI
jgi:membrane protease subunit (stomatin/prohibitin family)